MSRGKLISSGSPFEKANGYSRAVVAGDEVHIAGTTGYDYATMTMPDDVAEQTRNIYATFARVMKEAGGELADIVRLRSFVTDVSYCEPVVTVQGEVFGAIRPAATIVVVSALLKPEMKVEIEADARLRRTAAHDRRREVRRKKGQQGGLLVKRMSRPTKSQPALFALLRRRRSRAPRSRRATSPKWRARARRTGMLP